MSVTGFDAYCLLQAIRLHFTQDDYDFFKYSGKTRVSQKSFDRRKDKYYFHKLAKKYPDTDSLTDFLVSNILEDDNIWVGNLLEEEAELKYRNKQKVLQSLAYTFENDCKNIFELYRGKPNTILYTSGEYPILLTMALRKEVSPETVCILNNILSFLPMWGNNIIDTIRWPGYCRKIRKYTLFLPQDMTKYKLILKKILNEN